MTLRSVLRQLKRSRSTRGSTLLTQKENSHTNFVEPTFLRCGKNDVSINGDGGSQCALRPIAGCGWGYFGLFAPHCAQVKTLARDL